VQDSFRKLESILRRRRERQADQEVPDLIGVRARKGSFGKLPRSLLPCLANPSSRDRPQTVYVGVHSPGRPTGRRDPDAVPGDRPQEAD
jgi:hypothetical protein